jgi:alkylation response protein AidB-like acyl-CoA dehydrogenase
MVLGGSDAQCEAILPGICSGERILALAHEECSHHAPHCIATRAEKTARGYRLTGAKLFVLDGHVADAWVVVARTEGVLQEREGITLFLVPPNAPGAFVERTWMVDSRNSACVHLNDVEVPESDRIGPVGQGAAILDRVLDVAAVALSAEMLGGIQEAFDRTLTYLKERRQFGVPIGSFQALQHRAARMFCEIELTRSIVLAALHAMDQDSTDVPLLASVAKARASDTFVLVANEAIQMHGGVGVTDELDIGFFLKRARVAEMTFGDAAYHRDRFARLQGY